MFNSPLVTAAELNHIRNQPSVIVVDCRFNLKDPEEGRRAFAASHIPGSRYAHLDEDLSVAPRATEGRHPLPSRELFAERLGRWGIEPGSRVIAYDDSSGAIAARLWWMLRWLGHQQIAILDGGYSAWLAAGFPTESAPPPIQNTRYEPIGTTLVQAVTAEQLAERLARGGLLLDARAPERFAGAVEPIDPVAGHVPGAVNLPFQNLLNNGQFKPKAELRAVIKAAAADNTEREVIAMCGSGVTACHLLLALEIAELGPASLYAGSWSEWIRDPARPVGTGP